MLYAFLQFPFVSNNASAISTDMQSIGMHLMSYDKGGYILPFEVVSILLLAAILAVVAIAKREKPESK